MLLYFKKHLPVDQNKFVYRPVTGCLHAITASKKTVMCYKSERFDVYCAMVDLLKDYDRMNASVLCVEMRETGLPRHLSV